MTTDGKKDPQILGDRRKALEEAFFARQERELVEKFHRQAAVRERREALAHASGISDEATLDRLLALEIGPESLAALTLAPLVAVAWADQAVESPERGAVSEAAEAAGVSPGSPAAELLDGWLRKRPGPELMAAWKAYVRALAGSLDEGGRRHLREDLLARARRVAESAGGFLGVGTVSEAERETLAELERAFE